MCRNYEPLSSISENRLRLRNLLKSHSKLDCDENYHIILKPYFLKKGNKVQRASQKPFHKSQECQEPSVRSRAFPDA